MAARPVMIGKIVSRRALIAERQRWPQATREFATREFASIVDYFPQVGRVVCSYPRSRNTLGLEVLYPGLDCCPDWCGHSLEGRTTSGRGWWVPGEFYEEVDPSVAAFWRLTE